ncbi:hypothetical protein AA0113_g12307 [Alternaria arborescens]|uniref:Uncharacterized protein n=1 Tax=Alternaria arborescens TaxID=156630 RepID=A0A4V1WXF3_9PLEO|nr:hypothetical protein AA0113_g12307 [Alternaria arborescens]
MADRYSKFIVNGNGKNPGFRPIFEGQFGCTNIHDLKKQDFMDIAVEFDTVNAPLSLDDPDIGTKASQAQKEALRAAVDARRRTRQGEAKAKGGKRTTSGKKKATGLRAQAQKTGTTSAQPKKDKTNAQKDEASPSDDEIAEQDDDGDVRMAEDQDGGDTTTVVDPTADAVSGLHNKRKRRSTTRAPIANKRIRSTRSTPAGEGRHSQEPEEDKKAAVFPTRTTRATKQTRGQATTRVIRETPPVDDPSSNYTRASMKHSMVAKLKVEGSRVQAAIQVSETDGDRNMTLADVNIQSLTADQSQKQTARDTQTANTPQKNYEERISGRLQARSSSHDSTTSMGSHKNDLEDASAQPQDMPSAGSVRSNNKTAVRGEPLQKDKKETTKPSESEDSAGDETSNESEESAGSEVASDDASSVESIKESDVKNMLSTKNYFYDNSKSPYDEEEAHNRVCAKTGNMGSSHDRNWDPKFEGTHKVDGYMNIKPLWLAKTYDRSLMDPREQELYDAQKEEWERQDTKNARLQRPKKPKQPKKKKKRTYIDRILENR